MQKTSEDCDTRLWFCRVAAIIVRAMGRKFAVDWLPHYREVLVANAVHAVRDSFPTVLSSSAERRAWLGQPSERGDWHAVAVAAGAAAGPTATR
jgi:hypothetical protein